MKYIYPKNLLEVAPDLIKVVEEETVGPVSPPGPPAPGLVFPCPFTPRLIHLRHCVAFLYHVRHPAGVRVLPFHEEQPAPTPPIPSPLSRLIKFPASPLWTMPLVPVQSNRRMQPLTANSYVRRESFSS